MKQSALIIETPEGVTFSHELATPVVRAFAWILDAMVLALASAILTQIAGVLRLVGPDWAAAAGALAFFVFSIAYGIVCEWRWRGQTIGKRLFRLRVIDAHGLRLRLPQVVLRNLMRVFDSLPLLYLVGGAACLLSARLQRLGDLVANTVVVRERPWEEPDIERIAPAKYNSLLAWPHLAARLRASAEPEAVAAAVRAVTHRGEYDPAARVELFRLLAGHFRALAAYPAEALEGMSDEEYVRCVLRVIYRAQ
ncbi:MAG: RDD family protein [Acidobacteria bacterium]|nr:RDD family protein [Acidobacteriota bacterium]